MLHQNDHKLRADHHLRILEILNQAQPITCDWQVVLMFYTAIHAVNMHLSTFPKLKCESHAERNELIMPSAKPFPYSLPTDIYLAYNKLESASKIARYMSGKPPGSLKNSSQQFFGPKQLIANLKNLDLVLNHYQSSLSVAFEKVNLSIPIEISNDEFKVLMVSGIVKEPIESKP